MTVCPELLHVLVAGMTGIGAAGVFAVYGQPVSDRKEASIASTKITTRILPTEYIHNWKKAFEADGTLSSQTQHKSEPPPPGWPSIEVALVKGRGVLKN